MSVDTAVSPGEHYRPTGDRRDDFEAGVYRVVGTGDPVALLLVTDADGRRRSTGHLVRVPLEDLLRDFEPTEDPDAGFSPLAWLRNLGSGMYWDVRRFLP